MSVNRCGWQENAEQLNAYYPTEAPVCPHLLLYNTWMPIYTSIYTIAIASPSTTYTHIWQKRKGEKDMSEKKEKEGDIRCFSVLYVCMYRFTLTRASPNLSILDFFFFYVHVVQHMHVECARACVYFHIV